MVIGHTKPLGSNQSTSINKHLKQQNYGQVVNILGSKLLAYSSSIILFRNDIYININKSVNYVVNDMDYGKIEVEERAQSSIINTTTTMKHRKATR